MRESVRSRGIPVPSAGELLIFSVVCVAGWWGWSEYSERQKSNASSEPDVIERFQSMEALVAEGGDAVDDELAILSSSEAKSRREAARALGGIGAPARRALPALREAFRDSDARVRAEVIVALVRIDPDAPELFDAT